MRTPLNQKGQAVQVHTFNEHSDISNTAISDSVIAVSDVNDPKGMLIQVTSNIDIMVRFARGNTPACTDATAHMFLAANVPYYIKVPGDDTGVTANEWHIHAKGSVAGASGRIVVMEIKSF